MLCLLDGQNPIRVPPSTGMHAPLTQRAAPLQRNEAVILTTMESPADFARVRPHPLLLQVWDNKQEASTDTANGPAAA